MFTKETYIRRRAELKKLVGEGVIVLFGNNDAPCNYPANCYAPMRQDSSFLYYFGQHRDGLVGVIDIDHDEEMLFGDDIDVEDIVWMGFTPSVADLAAEVGVSKTAPPIVSTRKYRSWTCWASILLNKRRKRHSL